MSGGRGWRSPRGPSSARRVTPAIIRRFGGTEAQKLPWHILIVDDDPALGRLYAEALSPEGWAVEIRGEVEGAVRAFRAQTPDLVVLDAHLQNGSGFELAKRLRQEAPGAEVPLLFISGVLKAARHRADVIDQLGAIDFLEKPVHPGELAARIRVALGPEPPRPPPPPPDALVPTPTPNPLAALPLSAPSPSGLLRGELSEQPFFQVFAQLARSRASGLLVVRREKVKKIVGFQDGRPVAVKSNLLADCLGRVMVRAGMLTEDQCASSVERAKATGRRQGEALLELGYANERLIEEALELQVDQKLLDLFGWESGELHFLPNATDEQSVTAVGRSAVRVLHEGLSRFFDERHLAALLGDIEALAARLLPGGAEAGTTLENATELLPMVAALDGRRPLSELVEARVVEAPQALALVLALKLVGLCELVPPSAPPKRASMPLERFELEDPTSPDSARRLQERIEELGAVTYYERLGVTRRASMEEIHQAYLAQARDYHPDKHFQTAPAELKRLAERLFDLYIEAQSVLESPEERVAYDEATPETGAERAERILRADEAYRAGRALVTEAKFAEARERFREAFEGYPEEPDFLAWLALALFQANAQSLEAADRSLTMLAEARRRHPRLEEAALFAAHIHRAVGRAKEAERELAWARALRQDEHQR